MPIGVVAGIGAGVNALSKLFTTGYGAYQAIKGNNDLTNLENNRPQRTTDPNYLLNQKIAGTYGGQGYTPTKSAMLLMQK